MAVLIPLPPRYFSELRSSFQNQVHRETPSNGQSEGIFRQSSADFGLSSEERIFVRFALVSQPPTTSFRRGDGDSRAFMQPANSVFDRSIRRHGEHRRIGCVMVAVGGRTVGRRLGPGSFVVLSATVVAIAALWFSAGSHRKISSAWVSYCYVLGFERGNSSITVFAWTFDRP